MRNAKPLPLPKLASTIHGDARTALSRLATNVTADCETLTSVEAELEYFREGRDWFNMNFRHFEELARNVGKVGGAGASSAG